MTVSIGRAATHVSLLAAAAMVIAGYPRSAVADAEEQAFTIGALPVWFLTGGVTSGGTVATGDRGAFVGGEISLSRLRESTYVGLYADGYYDWGVDGTYLTVGPEVGILRRRLFPVGVGLDGGAALQFAGGTKVGGTARLFITLGTGLALYGRYLHFGTGDNEQVVQVGLTFKFPFVRPFGAGAN